MCWGREIWLRFCPRGSRYPGWCRWKVFIICSQLLHLIVMIYFWCLFCHPTLYPHDKPNISTFREDKLVFKVFNVAHHLSSTIIHDSLFVIFILHYPEKSFSQDALDEATDPWGVKAERVEMWVAFNAIIARLGFLGRYMYMNIDSLMLSYLYFCHT